jgi:hypothetical protein
MARMKNAGDLATLQMALIGYEVEKQKIELRMREIRAQLKGNTAGPSAKTASSGGESKPAAKRVLSPAARRRIAAAQKKRWAEHRKRAAAASKSE